MKNLGKTRVAALILAAALVLQLPQVLGTARAMEDSGAGWTGDTVAADSGKTDSGALDSGMMFALRANEEWIGGKEENAYITKVELREGTGFQSGKDAPLGHIGGVYDQKNDADHCDVYDSGVAGNTTVSNLTDKTAKDSKVMAVYWFRVPNDRMNEGDLSVTYEMDLPKEIVIGDPNGTTTSSDSIKTVVDGQTIKVADYTITGNRGTGHLKITYYGTKASNVRGTIAIAGNLNKRELGNTGNETLTFPLNGNQASQNIPIQFAKEPELADVKIVKELVGGKDNGNGIFEWKVAITHSTKPTAGLAIPGVVFTDEITGPQDYVTGSFKVDGNSVSGPAFVYSPGSDTVKPKLTYNFPDDFNTTAGPTVITYKTDINIDEALEAMGKGTTAKVENEAKLTYPTDVKKPDTAKTITSNKPGYPYPLDVIQKTGEIVGSDWGYEKNSKVEWTITLNASALNFNHTPVFTDVLEAYLKLDTTTVKLDGAAFSNFTYTGGTDGWGGTFATTTAKKWLDGAEHKLTFTTKVKDDYFLDNHNGVYNKAMLKIDVAEPSDDVTVITGGGGVGPGVPSSMVDKTNMGYDAATHILRWQVVVNGNGLDIKNAVFTDKFEKIGKMEQELISGSIKVYEGNGTSGALAMDKTVSYNNGTLGDRGLTGNFGEINQPYTITYETRSMSPEIWGKNQSKTKVENTAGFAWNMSTDLEGAPKHSASDKAEQETNSTVIDKAAGKYDYAKQETEWTITVNQNGMAIKDCAITDTIPGGQEYVEGSAKVTTAANPIAFSSVETAENVGGGQTLTMQVAGEFSTQQTITLRTKLKDLDRATFGGSTVKISNDAKITGTDVLTNNPFTEVKHVTKDIVNDVIKKTGKAYPHDGCVVWAVELNRAQAHLTKPKLTDVLPKDLILWENDAENIHTVRIYETSIASDGTMTRGQEVKGMLEVSYDQKNPQTCTFQFKEDINKAYMLEFTTGVNGAGNYSFTNTMALTGATGVNVDGKSNGVQGYFKTSNGWGVGELGKIVLKKVDANNPGKILSGAEFQLYDPLMNQTVTTFAEDKDRGTYTFTDLYLGRVYQATETKAPDGYILKTEATEITAEANPAPKEFKNVPATADGKITVKKVDGADNTALAGAQFTLKGGPVGGTAVTRVKTTGADGTAMFDNLAYGIYALTETKAPTGYTMPANPTISGITVSGDKTALANAAGVTGSENDRTITVKNTADPGAVQVTLVKTDVQTGARMAGVGFTLTKSDGTMTLSGVTDVNGLIVWANKTSPKLVYGTYTLTETAAPTGYKLAEPQMVTISGASSVVAVPVANEPKDGSVALTKTDAVDNKPLAGAQFSLTGGHKNGTYTGKTDGNGRIEWKNLPYGEYTLTETAAPAGEYELAEPQTVKIDAATNANSIEVIVTNVPKGGDVTITKQDKKTGKVLPGAIFELTLPDGQSLLATTDADGTVKFEGLAYGAYTLKEKTAPTGYIKGDEVKTFTIGNADLPNSKHLAFTFQNEPIPPKKNGGNNKSPWVPEPGAPLTDEPPVTDTVEVKTPPVPLTSGTEPGQPDDPVSGKVELSDGDTTSLGNTPKNGKATVTPDGKWSYTPEEGFHGTDEFTVNVRHADGTEEAVRVLVTIEDEEIPLTGGTGLAGMCVVGAALITGGILLRRKK